MEFNISKYSFKLGLTQELELVDITELYKVSRNIITLPHRVGFYVILWIESGNSNHFIDFNPIELRPNSIFFFHKDIVQQFDTDFKLKGKAILFTDTFFSKTEHDTKYLRSTILFNNLIEVSQFELDKKMKSFATIFDLMQEELNNKDILQALVLKNLLHNFLLLSEREVQKSNNFSILNSVDLEYVISFKRILENDFNQKRNVSFYTKRINLTEKRLNQATKKILGKTPKEVIDDRIMLEAKRLLVNTSQNAKEISYHLGFDEPTYFIQYFKKHALITPVEFREKFSMA